MLEPPRDPPPALQAELASLEDHDVARHARIAGWVYLAVVALSPLALWNGIESWPVILTIVTLSLAQSLLARSIARAPARGHYLIYAIGTRR